MYLSLDIQDLDFSEVGTWPSAVKALCFVLAAALALAGGYLLHLSGQRDELAAAERRESSLKAEYQRKRRLADELPAVRARRDATAAAFAAMLRRLPADTEVPGLIEDITRAAVANDLSIHRIDLADEQPAQIYLVLPIAIVVRGDYHQLGAFVGAVAALPRIVTLHDFEIAPDPPTDADAALVLSIAAKTYRYVEDAP